MLDQRVETFLAVCQTMNYTKAAQLLHITQPAASQHIHALEAQYGAKFFQYENRQLVLTECGKLFRHTAETMVHDVRRLEEALRLTGEGRSLCFGATLTIGEYCMERPLFRLLKQEPTLRLRMLTANTRELLSLLDQGEIDFAIVEGNFDRQAYESRVYATQRFIPVAATGYHFTAPVHSLDHLLGERLLIREPGSGTRSVLEHALEGRNLSVKDFAHVTESGSLNLLKHLTMKGAGVAFFYEPVVRQELEAGLLQEIPLKDWNITHDFSFLWQRGSAFSEEYLAWYQQLREK